MYMLVMLTNISEQQHDTKHKIRSVHSAPADQVIQKSDFTELIYCSFQLWQKQSSSSSSSSLPSRGGRQCHGSKSWVVHVAPYNQRTQFSKTHKLAKLSDISGWERHLCQVSNNNNNNNNNQDNIYGAVIKAEPLREFTRFIWWM